MAAVGKVQLLNATAFTGNGTGNAVSIGGKTDQFIAFLNVSAIGGGTSLVVTIQHSPDRTNWLTLGAFSAKTTTGVDQLPQQSFTIANSHVFPNLRASLAFTGGTTTATVTLEMYYDMK
jgi:hypothetical protein